MSGPPPRQHFGCSTCPVLPCTSLQLNSLGPDACEELRALLLHAKCAVSDLR